MVWRGKTYKPFLMAQLLTCSNLRINQNPSDTSSSSHWPPATVGLSAADTASFYPTWWLQQGVRPMLKEIFSIKNLKSNFKVKAKGKNLLHKQKPKGPQVRKNKNPSGQTRKEMLGTGGSRADKDCGFKKNRSCERSRVESAEAIK